MEFIVSHICKIYDFVKGPLMVITQKVTSLAFSLHDGLTRHEDELTSDQKYHTVR
jgi:lysophospholipid acyltransferase 1/2